MKPIIILLVIVCVWLLLWMIGTYLAVATIEEPEYEVVDKKSGYQIRQYESYIVAETEIKWSGQQVLNNWFRILAWYIFGWNTSKESIKMTTPVNDVNKESEKIAMTTPVNDIKKSNEKIAMTTPVNDIQSDDETHIVQFTMPSKYTLETLPVPNDDRVKLRKVESKKKAVLLYRGWSNETKVEKYKLKLINKLEQDKIEYVWDMVSAQYNPPLSFPLMRRNEILVEVK